MDYSKQDLSEKDLKREELAFLKLAFKRGELELTNDFLTNLAMKRVEHHIIKALFGDKGIFKGDESKKTKIIELFESLNDGTYSPSRYAFINLGIEPNEAYELEKKLNDALAELNEAVTTGKITNDSAGTELLCQIIFTVVAAALVIAGVALIATSLGIAPAALVAIAAGVGAATGTTLTVAGTSVGVAVAGGAAVVAGALLQGSLGFEGNKSLKNIENKDGNVYIHPFNTVEQFRSAEQVVQNHLDRCINSCKKYQRLVDEIVKEVKAEKKQQEKRDKMPQRSYGSEGRII
jgi:hypothetical protein